MFIEKNLNKIYNTFGREIQLEKLREECEEFIYAYDRNEDYEQEIADLFVVSTTLVLNITSIFKLVIFKINRTLKRIKENYYVTKNSM
jgi:phosphoribosyl-ATP pyrophosphohydrolase